MNFKDLQKELKAIKGVSSLSLIRQNVIKIDLDKTPEIKSEEVEQQPAEEKVDVVEETVDQPVLEAVSYTHLTLPTTPYV